MKYRKLTKQVEFEGIGIHSGKYSKIVLTPETENNGINFIIGSKIVPANIKYVIDTSRATTIGCDGFKVSTVEHLLSAIYCLYVKDISIHVYGDEIPVMDGSARVFVEKILSSRLEELDETVQFVKICHTIKFRINSSQFEVLPANKFLISCQLDSTPSEIVNNTKITLEITPEEYLKNIAYAKTFCYYQEIDKILSAGYGLGGSMDNVIIVDKNKIVNPEIMTYKNDEFVRHKILDFLGDLSLTNMYFYAEFKIKNPSHYSNIEFCRQFLNCIQNSGGKHYYDKS